MKGIKSFRRTFLLIAALYLACGISLLVWPAQSGLVICYVFGGISLLYGAVQIIRYCCNAAVSIFRYELVTGILCCAFGLFVILRADMVLAVLPFVFGCAIVFDSVMTLQNAIDLRRLFFPLVADPAAGGRYRRVRRAAVFRTVRGAGHGALHRCGVGAGRLCGSCQRAVSDLLGKKGEAWPGGDL